jgi:hypothetical protein
MDLSTSFLNTKLKYDVVDSSWNVKKKTKITITITIVIKYIKILIKLILTKKNYFKVNK